jgi:hypothetical protein
LDRTARGQCLELIACLADRQLQVISKVSHTGRLLPAGCARNLSHYDLLVAFWDPVQPHHVRQAAAEYDELGQDEFLARYGFGPARAYLLIVGEKSYDSKAILGVAHGFATGRRLGPHDFSGGLQGAAGVLRALGFEITNICDRGLSE